MWLEDLLPERTCVARIIRYVYSIDDWHGISTHNIQESALDLLNQVGKERLDPVGVHPLPYFDKFGS